MCIQRSLPFVPLPNANQVIRILQIQFGENSRIVKGAESGVNEWERVLIFY